MAREKEFDITPNVLNPNGLGGVRADDGTPVQYHTHDGVNSSKIQGVEIGARGVADGQVLTADGNGNAGWETVAAGSGDRALQMVVFDFTTDVVSGNGKFYVRIDERIDGMNLIDVHAEVITAGTTNTTDIQIANVTDGVDMLSTKLTIDSGETGSDTATTPAVIDTTKDDVVLNDVLRIDIDAVSTTAPKGLIVTLGFSTP